VKDIVRRIVAGIVDTLEVCVTVSSVKEHFIKAMFCNIFQRKAIKHCNYVAAVSYFNIEL